MVAGIVGNTILPPDIRILRLQLSDLANSLKGFRQINILSIGPQRLQAIELPRVFVKQVNHNSPVIQTIQRLSS